MEAALNAHSAAGKLDLRCAAVQSLRQLTTATFFCSFCFSFDPSLLFLVLYSFPRSRPWHLSSDLDAIFQMARRAASYSSLNCFASASVQLSMRVNLQAVHVYTNKNYTARAHS
jgi:hypothetical protein